MTHLMTDFIKGFKMDLLNCQKKNPKKYLIVDSNLDINENKKKILQKIIKIIR